MYKPDLSDLPESHKRWRDGRRPFDWNTFFYTTDVVAKLTGLSVKRIQQYCREHSTQKMHGVVFVLLDDDIVRILKRKGRLFQPREKL